MSDPDYQEKKPMSKNMMIVIVGSLLVLLILIYQVGSWEYERSISPTDPKTQIIEVNCKSVIFDNGSTKLSCEMVCVGFRDVSTIYPFEDCERELSMRIGN